MRAPVPTTDRLLSVLLAGLLGTAAGCATSKQVGKIEMLLRDQRYQEAVRVAAEDAQDRPDDPEAQRRYRRASVAWCLDSARQSTLAERDEEALAYLRDAERIAPENPVVADWIDKTNAKLADAWLKQAFNLEGEGEIDAAEEAFARAREYQPNNTKAIAGAARVLVIRNHRLGLGEDYYQEGVRKLRDALLVQAYQNFGYSAKYLTEDARAIDRREWVKRQLASERAEVARGFEQRGLFPAAHIEYRIVLLLDPGNPAGEAGVERTAIEAEALGKLEEADMLVRKGRLADASVSLAEGLALTELQKEAFERKRIDIEQAVHAKMYGRAYDLESDFLYEEAVEAYDELLAVADYYEDAIARRDTLIEYIGLAEDLYAQAEEASDDEARLSLLLQVDLFWPEYRDVPDLLQKLDPTRALKGR